MYIVRKILMMSEAVTVVDLLDDPLDDVVLVDVQNTIVVELIWSEIKKNVIKLNEECTYENETKSIKQVFNSLIMPAYNELDRNYKTSKRFEKVLSNTLQLLKNYPNNKFTHIKHLFDTMKLHKVKKKKSFVTLAVNLTGKKTKANTKRKFDSNDNIVKKLRVHTIELDEDLPILSKENGDGDVILLDDATDLDGEKENSEASLTTQNINQVKIDLCTTSPVDVICDIDEDTKSHTNDLVEDENSLLVPRNTETLANDIELIDVEKKIYKQRIERKIAYYKKQIAILEKQEVDDDSIMSPYIMSDKYKAQIVELYEDLCQLTGTDSVKRHEIRLIVNNGHPPGPVRRLERFLNNRIERDGLPPFPDFNDVVNCVMISNQKDDLGWNQPQIMREATSLFTQCGRALQRRRQNREWRHLMDTVAEEQLEVNDPAEHDPELEARLQQNRRIAMRKESDLLERFTMMQDQPRLKQLNSKLNELLPTVCKDSASSSNDGSVKLNGEIKKDILEKTVEEDNDNSASHSNVVVKSEKVEDLIEMLQDSGEKFTTTAKVIEDPSLIIEISSDSSSEEE